MRDDFYNMDFDQWLVQNFTSKVIVKGRKWNLLFVVTLDLIQQARSGWIFKQLDIHIWAVVECVICQVDAIETSFHHLASFKKVSNSQQFSPPFVEIRLVLVSIKYKLNCDGSVKLNSSQVTTDSVFGDHNGSVLFVFCTHIACRPMGYLHWY